MRQAHDGADGKAREHLEDPLGFELPRRSVAEAALNMWATVERFLSSRGGCGLCGGRIASRHWRSERSHFES